MKKFYLGSLIGSLMAIAGLAGLGQPLGAQTSFDTVRDAVETVIQGIQLGTDLARAEFLDDTQMAAIARHSKANLAVLPTLFVEFHGMNTRDVEEQAQLMQSAATEHGGREFT